MALVKVPENKEVELLQEFCNKSMFTFEGIDIKSKEGRYKVQEFEELIREKCGYNIDPKEAVWYWFTGDVMNKCFALHGDNAYPDDLVFLVIPDFYNVPLKVSSGARWFDDIVSSNIIKQHAEDTNTEPDFN